MNTRHEVKKNFHIQSAFKVDCETLLTDYAKLGDLSYTAFAKVWTDMSFTSVYAGKSCYEEVRKFTEMCFFTAKKFLIYSEDFHIKLGALYLLYGLYYKQPLSEFVKIRMTKSEFVILVDLMKEVADHKQADALYIFVKMKADDVFDLVYSQTLLAPDLDHYAKSFTMENDIFQCAVADEIEQQLHDVINNEDVVKIGDSYRNAVKAYKESSGESSLLAFDTSVVDELRSILREGMTQVVVADKSEGGAKGGGKGKSGLKALTIGEKRAKLKAKALKMKKKSRGSRRRKEEDDDEDDDNDDDDVEDTY